MSLDPTKAELQHIDTPHGSTDDMRQGHGDRLKLENVLHGLSKEQIVSEVEGFLRKYDLQDQKETFVKGALLAQRPTEWEQIDELTVDEKALIEYEHTHRWSMSRSLLFTVMVCAIGAAVQGWDQTGSNGANLGFPQEFGINKGINEPGGKADQWKVGLVNSIVWATAAVGCAISDPINRAIGRRGAIFVASLVLIACPIGMAFTHSWQALTGVRALFGIAIGLKGATVPILSGEVAPTVIRGALIMGWQLNVTVGIFLGFAANAILRNCGAITWRLQIASSFLPAVPLAILIYMCPESPRWYMRRGEMQKAFASMRRLRKSDLQAARDLYYAWVQWEAEKDAMHGRSLLRRSLDLFTEPRIRRATLASSVLHAGQDLCGINTIGFYSSTVFVDYGGANVAQALYASLGFGALNFAFTWPAVFTIDLWGRRTLNLIMFPLMGISLLATGMAFYIEDNTTRLAIVALFIYIYTIWYSIGEGPIIYVYSAESFPLTHRELGQAYSVGLNSTFGFILSLVFPFQLNSLGPVATFGFYTGTNFLSFICSFLFVRETKQLSLEELDQVFSVPTSTFVKYQVTEWLPYFIKRYVFFQRSAKVAPLFVARDMDVGETF